MSFLTRLVALLILLWAFGFVWFAVDLPGPAGARETDAIIVPTGGVGRIPRGLEMLRTGQAARMLVTGVDPEVKPGEFAAEYGIAAGQMRCCITLGFEAVNTRGNALESAAWVREQEYRSVRLITTDWHMRRATLELDRALPADVLILQDAVVSRATLGVLFLEYNKYLAALVAPAIAYLRR